MKYTILKDIQLKRVRHLGRCVVFSLMGLLIFVLILSFELSLPLLILLICIVFVLVSVVYFLSKNLRFSRLYVYFLLLLFTSLAIKRFALELYKIPSRSMESTLAVGDRILVTKIFKKIRHGDIIVFKNAWLNNNENMVKRCLAVPGDSVRIDSGTIFVNAESVDQYPGVCKIYKIRFNNKGNLLKCARLYNPLSTNWSGIEAYIQLANSQMDSFFLRFNRGVVSMEVADAETVGRLDSSLTCTEHMSSFRLPRKGDSVMLFKRNIVEWVKRISGEERDSLRLIRDKMKRGELEQCRYCFKESYYFVAGDNRCHSSDSRINGLIPESSIIGSAAFILFSLDPDASFPFDFRLNRAFNAF